MMHILADENIDAILVEWLRDRGHDVRWIAEVEPSVDDGVVLSGSVASGRILLTFDLDFGERVFRRGEPALGVVLLRLQTTSPSDLLWRFRTAWARAENHAVGHFIVVSNHKIRIRELPFN